MLGKIAQWGSNAPEMIKMEGHPLFIERRIYGDKQAFVVSWRIEEKIVRSAECPMLGLATDLAIRWASERNMFGDPPVEV